MNAEKTRLEEDRQQKSSWKKWGPYLSERQWGTVREDYSDNGNAWDYFSHDQARSRAYRWGEDGLAGISDNNQLLCFALALWNGKDPIIKERLFGLTNSEANHGEDVKEYYFYIDSTPTHSYMKYLYKYPQAAYPYDHLVQTNRSRGRNDFEYELLDTGVFDQDRYFDVFVEYAKASPEDILIQITVSNRGPEAATLHVLPTVWFRNLWSWQEGIPRPELRQEGDGRISASHTELGERFFYADGATELLFTENETNFERLFGSRNRTPYVKDGINNYIVNGRQDAVNPEKRGTKAAAHYSLTVGAGESKTVRLRLSDVAQAASSGKKGQSGPFGSFDEMMETLRKEADEFYASVIPSTLSADQANVMRQALAGMLWTKQFYYYDVDRWLGERGADPFKAHRRSASRNEQWHHMYNADIMSMPDKWEYPWFAAWDLAFHVIALTLVDEDFGKQQLDLMVTGQYLHPNGQLPAYEWNFGDVNPPVHAWSTIFTYRLEQTRRGKGDVQWLEHSFHKLLLNFTWWVNRKDRSGKNVFEGGFLGLDNIGVFDRSSPLPTGGYLEQADGTAWMGLFCQNMLEIALELSKERPAYLGMCTKFVEHFVLIASSMVHAGEDVGMWDEQDGFFYDVLRLPDGSAQRLKVRSMVGLLPFCAVTVFPGDRKWTEEEMGGVKRFLAARPELTEFIHDPAKRGYGGRRLASILNEDKLRRVLTAMLDENEFFSPYGIRALSRYHAEHPFVFNVGGQQYGVGYLPAESDSGMFGGNSNWRGPIWMPVNGLIVRALLQYYAYYGNDFTIECPTGSGRKMNLYQVAEELQRRLANIFVRNSEGRRAVYGGTKKFQEDPHWRDLILFYEYFHGDNGAGLGASHQTGWTGIIARMLHLFATSSAEQVLELGKMAAVTELEPADKAEATRAR